GNILAHMEAFLDQEAGYVDADVAFHRAIFSAAKQPAFDYVLRSLHDVMLDSRKLSYRGQAPTERALQAHKHIYEAILQGNPEAARTAMRKHLDETEEDLRQMRNGLSQHE